MTVTREICGPGLPDYYAIWEDKIIWGMGGDRKAAWTEAETNHGYTDMCFTCNKEKLHCDPMSLELWAFVEHEGGNFEDVEESFELHEGVLMLKEDGQLK